MLATQKIEEERIKFNRPIYYQNEKITSTDDVKKYIDLAKSEVETQKLVQEAGSTYFDE